MPKKTFVIIGPSDPTKVTRFGQVKDYEKWLGELVIECADKFDELYFIPDQGVYVDFATVFLKIKGPKSVIAVIPNGVKWVAERAKDMGITRIQEMKPGTGWTYLNTHLVGLAPYAVFLGYSSGSLLELVSSKYLKKYENLSTRFFIDKRSISIPLPEEIVEDVTTVSYFDSNTSLRGLLEQYVR